MTERGPPVVPVGLHVRPDGLTTDPDDQEAVGAEVDCGAERQHLA